MQHITPEEAQRLLPFFSPFAGASANGDGGGGGAAYDAASAEMKRLAGYDDANFCVTAQRVGNDGNGTAAGRQKFLLKIHGAAAAATPAARGALRAQDAAMRHAAAAVVTNQPIPLARCQPDGADGAGSDGDGYVLDAAIGGQKHATRLLTWVGGVVMSSGGSGSNGSSSGGGEAAAPSPELQRAVGALAARLSAALADFDHPSLLDGRGGGGGGSGGGGGGGDRAADSDAGLRDWSMESAAATIRRKLPAVAPALGARRAQLAERAAAGLDAAVASAAAADAPLPRQACHGDLNENNMLVSPCRRAVVGVIDWGDVSRSWRVSEVGIAAAYMLLLAADADADADADAGARAAAMLAAARNVVDGYLDAGGALTAAEAAVLPALIYGRIALSLVNGAAAAAAAPENAEYVLHTQRPGWRALEVLLGPSVDGNTGASAAAVALLLPKRLRCCLAAD